MPFKAFLLKEQCSMLHRCWPDVLEALIPSPPLFLTTVFRRFTTRPSESVATIPSVPNLKITQSSILTSPADRILTPLAPRQAPLIDSPRRVTVSAGPALITTPLPVVARI